MLVQGVHLCHDKLFADIYVLWHSCDNRSFAAIVCLVPSSANLSTCFFSYSVFFAKLMRETDATMPCGLDTLLSVSPTHALVVKLIVGTHAYMLHAYTVCQFMG